MNTEFKATEHKQLSVKEVNKRLKSKGYELVGNYVNTHETIKVKHLACGEVFQTKLANFISNKENKYYILCPICRYTKYEKKPVYNRNLGVHMKDTLLSTDLRPLILKGYIQTASKL